jgi:hypothetical protein
MINADGTAVDWTNIQVTQQVPGERGNNRDGKETPHPLTAAIPEGQECTGTVAGQDNVCLVRCQNPARAGPFGGVVPVQMVAAGNATAAAARRRARRIGPFSPRAATPPPVGKGRRAGPPVYAPVEPLSEMDPALVAELRADGEDI